MAERRGWRSTSWARLRGRPQVVAAALVAAGAALAASAGLVVGMWGAVCHDCPSVAQIYTWEPKQSTKILAHDGELVAELFQERRTPVALEDLPEHVVQAFLTVEDRRFYRHGGFDYQGVVRAAIRNVVSLRITGGGSTITQQLARNMFTEEVGFEQRLPRKVKELRVARELENVYTKDQILAAYLNQINFGHGWYGIESAAQRYFGKAAPELDPAEVALLAALPKAPTRYSPFRNAELALSRRNLVLRMMREQGHMTEAERARWAATPLPEGPHGPDEADFAPYFVELVRTILDGRYGSELYRSGLRVYTSLDMGMQRAALAAMDAGFQRIEGQRGYRHPRYDSIIAAGGSPRDDETPYLQGMFVAMEAETGEIRALIGGRDFGDSKFNRATQARRQPGSAFKPFVFTAAVASGIPVSHVIFDAPLMLEQADGSTWAPRNYDRDFSGPTTLREAMKRSLNIVAVKLGLEVGLETVAQYARRMGIDTPIPRYPSTSIGAADVIPLQLTAAYSSLATLGTRVRPRPILRIEDADGRLLWESRAEQERVLEPEVAAIVTDILRDVVDRGTAHSARDPGRGNLPYNVPAAGKTGTTNDATDIWFVGYTPELLAGVWFGFDRPARILTGAAGGQYAAPVWGQFMRLVYAGDNPLRPVPAPWAYPPELTRRDVDRETGKLAHDWCPPDQVYAEIFIPGTEPTETCDLHGGGLLGVPLRGLVPDSAPVERGRIRF
jgi:penicillin-binding protein 1A